MRATCVSVSIRRICFGIFRLVAAFYFRLTAQNSKWKRRVKRWFCQPMIAIILLDPCVVCYTYSPVTSENAMATSYAFVRCAHETRRLLHNSPCQNPASACAVGNIGWQESSTKEGHKEVNRGTIGQMLGIDQVLCAMADVANRGATAAVQLWAMIHFSIISNTGDTRSNTNVTSRGRQIKKRKL